MKTKRVIQLIGLLQNQLIREYLDLNSGGCGAFAYAMMKIMSEMKIPCKVWRLDRPNPQTKRHFRDYIRRHPDINTPTHGWSATHFCLEIDGHLFDGHDFLDRIKPRLAYYRGWQWNMICTHTLKDMIQIVYRDQAWSRDFRDATLEMWENDRHGLTTAKFRFAMAAELLYYDVRHIWGNLLEQDGITDSGFQRDLFSVNNTSRFMRDRRSLSTPRTIADEYELACSLEV